jgi:hypothetical protein
MTNNDTAQTPSLNGIWSSDKVTLKKISMSLLNEQ